MTRKETVMSGSASSSRKEKTAKTSKSTIETFVQTLSSHDDVARVKARHSLVMIGKAAVPSLIKALEDKHYLMRWEAAKTLAEIGDPEAAAALVKTLEDEEFDVRWLAAEGLIKMNVNGLKPLLLALEHQGESVLLREGAHHVVHDLAKGGLRKYLAPVLTALESVERGEEVPWLARQALDMLEKLKGV
jgi:HEAT repeat protein